MTTRQTVTIQGPDDRQKIATWARNVETGTVVTFRKKSRSTEQSAKMWAMLHEVAEQVEWYGQKIDAEDWKDMFTASLRHARVVPGIDKGTFVPLGMHTSTMTIEEMTNLIELIYAFGAEHNVIFKDPKQDTDDSPSPSQSSDAADEAAPPSEASSAATLLDIAREMLALAVLSYPNDRERDDALQQCLSQCEDRELGTMAKIDDIAVAARAVATKSRTLDQARAFLADRLGTTIQELSV